MNPIDRFFYGLSVLIVLLLLAALLSSCATLAPSAPLPAAPVRLPPVPMDLRTCLPPTKPPAVPGFAASPEVLKAYAWAEAQGRWTTAARLDECRARLRRLNDWIGEIDRGLANNPPAAGNPAGADPDGKHRTFDETAPGMDG